MHTQTARVFQSGNSQAVRLPKTFRFQSKEVEIFRRGNEVVLREKPKTMAAFVDALMAFPEDFFPDVRIDTPPEPLDIPQDALGD